MLHTLSLRHNKLSTATASIFGDILLYNTALKHVNLAWNAMGHAAGVALANGIIYNVTLQVVALFPTALKQLWLEPKCSKLISAYFTRS